MATIKKFLLKLVKAIAWFFLIAIASGVGVCYGLASYDRLSDDAEVIEELEESAPGQSYRKERKLASSTTSRTQVSFTLPSLMGCVYRYGSSSTAIYGQLLSTFDPLVIITTGFESASSNIKVEFQLNSGYQTSSNVIEIVNLINDSGLHLTEFTFYDFRGDAYEFAVNYYSVYPEYDFSLLRPYSAEIILSNDVLMEKSFWNNNYSFRGIRYKINFFDIASNTVVSRAAMYINICLNWQSDVDCTHDELQGMYFPYLISPVSMPYNTYDSITLDGFSNTSMLLGDISYFSYENSFTDGYNVGSKDGHSNGYNTGYDDGYEDGYSFGYDDGNDFGYDVGYKDGQNLSDATELTDAAKGFLFALMDAPVHTFLGVFDFSWNGFDFLGLVRLILSLMIIAGIVKVLA